MGKETLNRLFSHALGIIRQISVEPCYLGYALSYGLYSIIVSEIYISKVCKVNLALGDEFCDNIQGISG